MVLLLRNKDAKIALIKIRIYVDILLTVSVMLADRRMPPVANV